MYFFLVAQPKVLVGWLSLHPRRVTKSYCLEVRLEEKEDEADLEVVRAWHYKASKRSYAIQGHYYETIATRK